MATQPLRTPTFINLHAPTSIKCVGGYYQHQHTALVVQPWPPLTVEATRSLMDGQELVVEGEETSSSSTMGKAALLAKFGLQIPLRITLEALQATIH